MESFSLLKYWRGGGGAATTSARVRTTTTIAASILHSSDTDEDDDFIDLDFAVQDDEDTIDDPASEDEAELDKDFKFANHGISDLALSLSPSNDIFFKNRLLPIDAERDTKLSQLPASLRKSAAKLRVLMLGHRRFKIEEAVPIMSSLFTRDNGSRNRERNPEAEEKLFTREAVHKYISKIKPLYVRVSRKYGEKLRFGSEAEKADGPKKRLAKSRSAPSATVAAAPPEALPQRRDDSLLQQQDGIQSAIAHCKRSFNVTRESSETGLSDPGGGDEG